jgi:hypothetical protein
MDLFLIFLFFTTSCVKDCSGKPTAKRGLAAESLTRLFLAGNAQKKEIENNCGLGLHWKLK